MRILSLALLAVAPLLGSCATLPKSVDSGLVSDDAVVEAVRCEFEAAFPPGAPDPAGLANWGALTTLTSTQTDTSTTQPTIAGVAGSMGVMKWKAPTSSLKLDNSSEAKGIVEYPVMRLADVDPANTCPQRGSFQAAHGLDLADWLRRKAAGMPDPVTGARTKSLSYDRTFTVTASAGGGLSFELSDFSLKIEGNSISHVAKYQINVQFQRPQLAQSFATFIDDLRLVRDEDEDKKTTITLAPGQTIIIQ